MCVPIQRAGSTLPYFVHVAGAAGPPHNNFFSSHFARTSKTVSINRPFTRFAARLLLGDDAKAQETLRPATAISCGSGFRLALASREACLVWRVNLRPSPFPANSAKTTTLISRRNATAGLVPSRRGSSLDHQTSSICTNFRVSTNVAHYFKNQPYLSRSESR